MIAPPPQRDDRDSGVIAGMVLMAAILASAWFVTEAIRWLVQ